MTDNSIHTGRRKFIKAGGAAAIAGLAGCSGSPPSGTGSGGEESGGGAATGSSGSETQTVEIWIDEGQSASSYGEELDRIFSQFESDTDYEVKLSATPYPEFLDKIQTALSGGQGPDIIKADVVWTAALADKGWLETLDDRYEDADFSTDDFYDASVRTSMWDGDLIGVPYMDGEWGLWYYNADMVEEAGYDPMDPPMETWDDVIQVAKDIKANTGKAPISMTGADTETLSAQWSGFYFTTGASSWLNDDQTEAVIDQESGVKTAQFYQTLNEEGLLPNGTANNNQFDMRKLFTTGQTAMYQVGSWERDILTEKSDINFGITSNPMAPGGEKSSMYGGFNWVMNKNSNAKDGAWQLIERLTTKEAQLNTASLPPAMISASEERFSDWKDPLGRDAGSLLLEQVSNAKPRPVHPKYPSMSTALRQSMQSVLLGDMTAEEAMNDTASKINELL
ncbi:ABC transporter substrate-binding protein [Haloferax marisrubri]|uniref:Sugar ABC transporter substrate-binding protein n=1 Tax=Haloferax marisrubri TaxID=1544719 RepID=A0A2P4NLZ0_9EURY|nr:sugar ABC transporter substrate-binding protein [Haloferax marisrubri]POG54159.1 sugar ABC transporter substrate-binding protein [Haloferax marisrubri]